MKRKRRISRLMCEIKRLRKENKQLHDKHWSECRQIALYDDEARKAKGEPTLRDYVRMCDAHSSCGDWPLDGWAERRDVDSCQELLLEEPTAEALISQWCAEHPEQPESVSEQPEKPKKTYKEDFLEKFPDARRYYYGDPASCRKNIYGHGISCCPGYDGKDGRNCVGCWNEVMLDETD